MSSQDFSWTIELKPNSFQLTSSDLDALSSGLASILRSCSMGLRPVDLVVDVRTSRTFRRVPRFVTSLFPARRTSSLVLTIRRLSSDSQQSYPAIVGSSSNSDPVANSIRRLLVDSMARPGQTSSTYELRPSTLEFYMDD